MIYLLLSVLSSSAIMVVFKLFERFRIKTADAIVVNYAVATLLSFSFDGSGITLLHSHTHAWFPHALCMGVLFITLFNIIGTSTQKMGISVTTVANKMSLVIPVLFAVWILNENLGGYKIAGLLFAALAVLLSSYKQDATLGEKKYLYYPLIVFFGSGAIDAYFKFNEEFTLGDNGLEPFTGWIFLTAGCIGFGYWIIRFLRKKEIPAGNVIWAGILLGIPNYFSVYFLLKALSIPDLESSVVIPINNLGVVAMGALAGILFFGERPNKFSLTGLLLCFISIVLIGMADYLPI
jgi:drug/metabolite transporter (DMT)-like permease